MKSRQAISPTREEDFSGWYQWVIQVADLAENSEVRGCMIIKPWGYALWENIQAALDYMLKSTGHRNAYFPLLIPLSHLQREAKHVKGFAKECAVVTHCRLETYDGGKLIPTSPLKEPLIVRPTSETIIGSTFARWVHSYRDLPILLNQWANVVRWEMRPRLFLRTAEFLWQEGHTVHATEAEATEETKGMLSLYESFARDYLALPVISGEKTISERFPGAVRTFCIEAMAQDRRAVQAGTSHFFGQNFSRASGIRFQSRSGRLEYAWTTSWGVSTRLIGTLIMAHSDDNGLVLPPRIAPTQVVVIPLLSKGETHALVLTRAESVARELRRRYFCNQPIRVELDTRNLGNGAKKWEWIKRGVPIRLELGSRDLETGSVAISRRDLSPEERCFLPADQALAEVPHLLANIQANLLTRATNFCETHTHYINSEREFYQFFTPRNTEKPEIHGGFALTYWNDSSNIEEKLKTDLKVTLRCIPSNTFKESGICIFTGKPSSQLALFAKSY
ncbi:Proline--tRNA ligase [Candidatus Xiphinematobacter sp. Idaho Grape]|uniref:proline--tRNA ligase n=1 Tax=Candidatus Xiphinematobacter sp. Idaho Grape TaxID=1704307 RepID=UPI000705A6B4|nr:proline--tRNA ligase [Candidatus Xiphinematobacter sp. Idaho Grape]ALJ56769.1 Proline--tRNA ligase [Candidatus Xiphinematobacter sp. Idaho Grape]